MDPYVGEIRLFAGKYVPRGWAICDGSEIAISQNTLLYSIIGIQFGGDGKTTFKLPDLRNRVPMHQGVGPGLTPRAFASTGGETTVTLDQNQIPDHTHTPQCISTKATEKDPTGAYWAFSGFKGGGKNVYTGTPSVQMNPQAIGVAGGSQPHNNVQPYLALNFIIALEGIYPEKES
jgi:microcystin-dependent protein